MTPNTYLMCFFAGLLGVLFHVFAVKIPAVKSRTKAANLVFTYKEYLNDDLAGIFASLLTVMILLITLDELIAFKPAVIPYLKFGFVFVGFTGSSILIAILGKAQGKINSIVDIKTNIADRITPTPNENPA
jgi:hypothetical protein